MKTSRKFATSPDILVAKGGILNCKSKGGNVMFQKLAALFYRV